MAQEIMNKHIIKRLSESYSPIVWCGRSIPGNSRPLNLNQAALATDKNICRNCVKAAIKALSAINEQDNN